MRITFILVLLLVLVACSRDMRVLPTYVPEVKRAYTVDDFTHSPDFARSDVLAAVDRLIAPKCKEGYDVLRLDYEKCPSLGGVSWVCYEAVVQCHEP